MRYGYTSRCHDSDTGLMYFRARYYDAVTGEFTSHDPAEYYDGMSLFRGYFIPSLRDPLGFCAQDDKPPYWVPDNWAQRVPGCLRELQAAIAGGILLQMPCAAALLGHFLNDNMENRVVCPKACQKALNEIDPGQLVVDSFPNNSLVECGKGGRIALPDFQSPHNFTGKTDLHFAFGNMTFFGKNGGCSWNCGPEVYCCCDCKTTCGFELHAGDVYDFCSSLGPPKPGQKPSLGVTVHGNPCRRVF